jgi:hypothetical protein
MIALTPDHNRTHRTITQHVERDKDGKKKKKTRKIFFFLFLLGEFSHQLTLRPQTNWWSLAVAVSASLR